MTAGFNLCSVCGLDSTDYLGGKADLRSRGLPVTWKNFKAALGLDENGSDPDDPITCGPDEMKHWRAEFDGTAHKVHFDSDTGRHCKRLS
jgi:hypothetical protein